MPGPFAVAASNSARRPACQTAPANSTRSVAPRSSLAPLGRHGVCLTQEVGSRRSPDQSRICMTGVTFPRIAHNRPPPNGGRRCGKFLPVIHCFYALYAWAGGHLEKSVTATYPYRSHIIRPFLARIALSCGGTIGHIGSTA